MFRPQDCSTASLIILLSLSSFLLFRSLRTDLSDGQKIIWSKPHSVSFWTINSTLSRLFGIAMIILFFSWILSCICSEMILHSTILLSQRSIRTSYLIFLLSCSGLWIQSVSPIFALRTFLSCNKRSVSETMIWVLFLV